MWDLALNLGYFGLGTVFGLMLAMRAQRGP